jgi:azurin
MKRYCLVTLLALSLPVAAAPAAAQTTTPAKPGAAKPASTQQGTAKPGTAKPAGAARTIEMTGGDDMKFNVTELTAKPGETLRIQLKNIGTLPKMAMAHNVVVLKPTTKVVEFANAAAMARDTEFVPAAMKADVVAATAMAGPGETVEVTFKVPTTAGSYPFICSFPGHFTAGMKGTLAVK